MRSRVRLLFLILLLGSATQQGWLQAVLGFITDHLGGPGATAQPLPQVDLVGLFRRLGQAAAGLPDPWYDLAVVAGGIIGLVLAGAAIEALVGVIARLGNRRRGASV
ncbi:hypothetical protein E2C06_04835 [Dankookia rubra]|uniref:Uncharacterized protein n=1 Tax=Dankookia rubra TaxID=1442381 RepID=A0A4R5QJR4_9PROT|nr:hypothetical protein [Dankookia rubra]TDH63654.1 hypothetical protein E2C06_04835 [Dankookia rubra]